jgi:hypothetical protein
MAPDGEHQNPIGADPGIRSLQDYPGPRGEQGDAEVFLYTFESRGSAVGQDGIKALEISSRNKL